MKLTKVTRYVLLGQVCLIGGLAVCYLLRPELLRSAGGLSNYGVYRQTVIPYTLAFGLGGLFTWLAAFQARRARPAPARLPAILIILAALFLIVLLSTYAYKHGYVLNTFHRGCAIGLFVYEIATSIWLTASGRRNWSAWLLLTVFLGGCLVSLLSLLNVIHVLFIGQSLAGVAFAFLLVKAVNQAQTAKSD